MKSEILVSALEKCASMLHTPKGVYVVHHARQFAEWVGNPVMLGQCRKPFAFAQMLEICMSGSVEPLQFRSDIHSPTLSAVERHVWWMVREIPQMEVPKVFRWIGSAGGAMAYHRRGIAPQKDLIDARDMPIAIQAAKDPKLPYHLVAHIMLGYMQMWLWAAGGADKSIDKFRLMNNPNAQIVAPA